MRNGYESPIRWGIAGTGWIAGQFADALAMVDDCELVAVASRKPERAVEFGNQHDIPTVCSSYEALAENHDVDVVYVATPHSMHERHTLLFLSGGKSVLVEKPFAVNELESSRMVQAARSAGLFLMEAMWSRFLPSYVQLMEMMSQGVIGSIVMIEANMGYWYPFDPTSAQFDSQRAGGSLLDLGVYPAQLCSLLLGRPDSIVAAGHVGKSGVDEQVGAVLHHSGGALGVIASSISSTLSCSAHIYGTDGSIELPIFMHCPQNMTLLRAGQSERMECGNDGNGLQYEAAEVVRCLQDGLTESPIMPLDESNSIMGTLDAIRKQIGLVYPGEIVWDAEIASEQFTRQAGIETKEQPR